MRKQTETLAKKEKLKIGEGTGGKAILLSIDEPDFDTDPDLHQSFSLSVFRLHRVPHNSVELKASNAHFTPSSLPDLTFPHCLPLCM